MKTVHFSKATLENTMKQRFIIFTVFIILLCASCSNSQVLHKDNNDTINTLYVKQPIKKVKNTNFESTLATELNISMKIQKYEIAIEEFYTVLDNSINITSEMLNKAINTISVLEQAIAQFKEAGGNPFAFSDLEEIIYEDKNYLLLEKFKVSEKLEKYLVAIDDFYMFFDQKTAEEALKKNKELRDSIIQFKESGGDTEIFSQMEQKLIEAQSILEQYAYQTA